MGQIHINVIGSFRPCEVKVFNAMQGGHADAVAQAIEWLAGTVLPHAIAQDHQLHDDGKSPSLGWARRNPPDEKS